MVDDHIVGLPDGRVRLVPHSPEWARLFAAEKERLLVTLQPYLGSIVLDIQHVGSTSIPGIPAKPIIDIGVAVTNHDAARVTIEPLEQMGYVYLGEHEVPGRHFFYLGDAGTTGRTHHLHMLEQTNPQWRQQIGFRDYLTAHPAIAAAYGVLKTELAVRFAEDRPAYLEGKADFITQVLRLSVPDRPLHWTTIEDADLGLRFDYAPDVVDSPVTVIHSHRGQSRRLHLSTPDHRSLYFEVTVYADPMEPAAAIDRFRAELAGRFPSLEASDLGPIELGGLPGQGCAFAWDDTRRDALYARSDGHLLRVIVDPRGPLNLAMLETLRWSGHSPAAAEPVA